MLRSVGLPQCHISHVDVRSWMHSIPHIKHITSGQFSIQSIIAYIQYIQGALCVLAVSA